MKNKKLMIVSILFMILFVGITYYLFLPAINLSDPGFWAYLFVIVMVATFVRFINCIDYKTGRLKTNNITKLTKAVYLLIGAVFVGIIVLNIICSPNDFDKFLIVSILLFSQNITYFYLRNKKT